MKEKDSENSSEEDRSLDYFICDILQTVPKNDIASMEHPMFSLSTKKDVAIRRYEHNGNYIEIAPGAYGIATIFDKDILLYCISQLVEGINRGKKTSPIVRLTAYDLLISTNRNIDGRAYQQLKEGLDRLRSTSIKTNVATSKKRIIRAFGVIDSYRIVEKSPTDQQMVSIEITLSDWLYNAITAKEVLTIDEGYFRLRKPMERRLYELARKHCGRQLEWTISLELLHKKSGSGSLLREFRRIVKAVAASNQLPSYSVTFSEESDVVTFSNRTAQLKS